MEGWLSKRGPTSDFKWARRWCVLTPKGLEYFADDACKQKKGSITVKLASKAVPFKTTGTYNYQAPGEATLHWQDKPYGFVLDIDPEAGRRRHLYYFDAGSETNLQAWTSAFTKTSQPEAPKPSAPPAAMMAARGSVLRALQGASSRSSVAQATTLEASRRASSKLISSLMLRCCEEKDVPIEHRALAEAHSESKRCSKAGSLFLGALTETKRNSQATVGNPAGRASLLALQQASEDDDKAAYVRASLTGAPGFFAVGRSSTLQLQVCPEVCGDVSDSETSDSSSSDDDEEQQAKKPRKVRNAAKDKALSDVERNPEAFKDLPAEFQADKDVVLAAVKGNPDMLQYASESLRSDREVVMASVQKDGRALRHSVLQADRDIVMAATLQNQDALQFADEGLKKDPSIALF